MHLHHEMLHGVFGFFSVPSARDQQRPDDRIGLFRIQFGKGFMEMFFARRVEPIQTNRDKAFGSEQESARLRNLEIPAHAHRARPDCS